MSLQFYPDVVFDSTPPDEFSDDVLAACEAIKDACAGWGTDEQGVIDALGTLNGEMRHLVNLAYEQTYDKDLRKVMKSECGSGDFGFALQLMALPPHEADAMICRKAMSGMGTKERLLWPLLCGRSNEDMDLLKSTYFNMYDKDLSVQLASELGGDFERLIFHCLQGNEQEFDEDFHSDEKVEEDVEQFHSAGEGQWGTDEKSLFEIICKSPPTHLERVNELYVENNEVTLLKALDTELGGDVEKGAKYAVGMKLKPFETMAAHIKSTCAGFGTDELALTCCIIRYQPYLSEINAAHEELFEKTIQDRIESEVSGDYKKLLLTIVDAACAE
mmetsp:Transcript_388/g.573  ORF Transcript_388/g.573 Transcript_388/m.573 type:complete len:331 (+) Transcript_388:63-1055(+)|eukprot:CAMPEP_0202444026 /NCGR_PEP_ID=MMETSP1360-20130828/3181_1 /ASSEMBLY_ACC=CAM_ASM_000848 /TAXON_ID=515479 /ORGANISM="Licmophora paradoxa, Strain CCMP2313" /LENGTH=330 /DNA_ID=CAMNT_0049059891 /DNA_START=38 /DNA_END=1030 /DNA_ORIENTATION=+